jgi:hypothetical protein
VPDGCAQRWLSGSSASASRAPPQVSVLVLEGFDDAMRFVVLLKLPWFLFSSAVLDFQVILLVG